MLYCIWHEHKHIQKVRGVILYMTWAHTHSKGKRCYIVYDMNTHTFKSKRCYIVYDMNTHTFKGNMCYIVYDMNTPTFKR